MDVTQPGLEDLNPNDSFLRPSHFHEKDPTPAGP